MKYLRTRRDKSHVAIQTELRKRGLIVVDLSGVGTGVSDLLISNGIHTILCELKEPDGEIYLDQLSFAVEWKGLIAFAQTADECIAAVNDPLKCLSKADKAKIDGIVIRYRAKTTDKIPRITVKRFEKLMEQI